LTRAILDLAAEAGAPLRLPQPDPPDRSATWGGFPQAGADRLTTAYVDGTLSEFGQIALSGTEARHLADRDLPTAQLIMRSTPADVRNAVRIESGFRPLPTRIDLPRGWRVPLPAQRPR